jgi:hypothetical protein
VQVLIFLDSDPQKLNNDLQNYQSIRRAQAIQQSERRKDEIQWEN